MSIRLPASQLSSLNGPVPFSLRRIDLSAMWAVSQSESWMAFEANATLDRKATSARHRSNSTVNSSTALMRLNSLLFLVASSHAASASAGYDLPAEPDVLAPGVPGATDAPWLGLVLAAGEQAATTIARPATSAAKRDDRVVDKVMLAVPPPHPSRRAGPDGPEIERWGSLLDRARRRVGPGREWREA